MGPRATIFPNLTQMKPSLHAQPIYREVRNLQWIQPVGEDRVQGMC